ncbi:MAG: hypothetical protein P8I93_07965 [Crocinitomicaceae bacterium]|nr:hypothetical protein [Crocinitomicaceae bacterium]
MKKLLSLITFFFFVSFSMTLSQTENITIAQSKMELKKSKQNGIYYFTIHPKASKEDVAKSAAYYPSYFSVDYDDATKIAKITMIDNNEKTRMVLLRFLSSVRSQKIQVDGTSMFVHEFYDNYLK